MYRQIVHFLQGQVLVRIECGCPERMLNLCGMYPNKPENTPQRVISK